MNKDKDKDKDHANHTHSGRSAGPVREHDDAAVSNQALDRQFSWNLICSGFEAEKNQSLNSILRKRVDSLAGRLKRFGKEDAVHLHVALTVEAAEGRQQLRTRIDLRLPATVLHADANHSDFGESVAEAFDVLEKRLTSYLAALRGEHRWRRFSRRRSRSSAQGDEDSGSIARTFGAPSATGPETREDVIRNFILRHYHRLLLYVHRRIIVSESELSIPLTSVDAREVLDEVTRLCLSDPAAKPVELSYELWLYRTIDDELKRICEEISEKNVLWEELPPDEEEPFLSGDVKNDEEGLRFEEWMTTSFDRDDTRQDEAMPDSGAVPPDMSLLGKDLVSRILEVSTDWPEDQREILQLYFLEGFDAVEIAMIRGMQPPQVDEVIMQLRERLRRLLREESDG